ncbi:signal peptidase I [Cellulomonas endometrii]|uniref:signal peptidase I n=1 Tax=Cellulomonas endometrii TaxID=3036301 RepID=UPI0024AD16B3|nr:signal peptidase I [Cellulomonas endometrii]
MSRRPPPTVERRAPHAERPRHAAQESTPRRALRTALWTVIVVCGLAYAGSLAVPLWFQANGQRLLIVTSGSMSGPEQGSFDAGDAVVMRRIDDPSQLRVGQVATFWPAGSDQLVTHRIVALKNLPVMQQDAVTGKMVQTVDPETGDPLTRPYIFTKGDANAEPDPNATPLAQVRGIILHVYPRWGWVLDWAGSPQGRMVMLVPPLAALAALELMSLLDDRRSRRAAGEHRAGARERHDDALLLG